MSDIVTLLECCLHDLLILPEYSFFHVGISWLDYKLKLLKLPLAMLLASKNFLKETCVALSLKRAY